jgi:flagellar biosynthesis/type III secretory pathway protein FliH
VDWLKFINAEKKEEFMTLAQECRHLSRALEALEETSANEVTRDIYEGRLRAIRDEWSRRDYWKDEGLKEGLKKGLKKGREEGRGEGIWIGMEKERAEIIKLI